MNKQMQIVEYRDIFREQMISVWERSVRATHNFLVPSDIDFFKLVVAGIDFKTFKVFCLVEQETVRGFIGVAGRKIEMLFLSPECIGQGNGLALLQFAVKELNADQVDVNEQNVKAVKFYSELGFVTYERTEKDSEGKDYPILKMKL